MLQLLEVKGALVTIDAMGCQKEIAQAIVDKNGDYVLTVKDNQPTLRANLEAYFAKALENNFAGLQHSSYETEDSGHGRHENRCYDVIVDPPDLIAPDWPQLKAIGICSRERTSNGKTSTETIFFIGSRKASAKVYGKGLRGHWSIENNLHWQLDVTFAEDHNRVSRRHGAENLAVLRRLALSLLKQNTAKESLACKRLRAALEPDFLLEILAIDANPAKV